MKRLKAQDHAKALVRANGLDLAYRIADRCMRSSGPDVEQHLPTSSKGPVNIFFPSDRNGRGAKTAIRERARTFGFWTQVRGILNKQGKVR